MTSFIAGRRSKTAAALATWTVRCLFVCAAAALVGGCEMEPDDDWFGTASQPLSARVDSDRAALAMRWAPIHYQDVDQTGRHALRGAADYLARYDFDGDLELRNNWQHAGNAAYPLDAHVYYSVVETTSHWFVVYMFFHPRDWSDFFFDTEHENDAEGVLMTIHRDGSRFGALKSAVTVAHIDFFSYLPAGSDWFAGSQSVDGTLPLDTHAGALHPVTAQEAKGHGLKARGGYDIIGDGVIYYPSLTTAEVPSGPTDTQVAYKLVDIFAPGGLWAQRRNPSVFAGFGAFAGDKSDGCGAGTFRCDENAANPPWGWDDHDDAPGRGALATDPAGLVGNYFRIPESISGVYTYNPYREPLTDNQLHDLRPSHAASKCADVEGASTADGATVSLFDCHGGGNQLFWAFQQAGGFFVLVNAQSGKCLDQVPGTGDGLKVLQWSCHFGDNQQWRPEQAPASNSFKLINKQSGQVLSVAGQLATSNGSKLETRAFDGSGSAMWDLVRR